MKLALVSSFAPKTSPMDRQVAELDSLYEEALGMVVEQDAKIDALEAQIALLQKQTEVPAEGPFMGSHAQRCAEAYEYWSTSRWQNGMTLTEGYERAAQPWGVSRDGVQKTRQIAEETPEVFEAMRNGWFVTMKSAIDVSRQHRFRRSESIRGIRLVHSM